MFDGLAQVLSWLYDLTRSYGLSIILLTLGVRILVTPLTIKGTRSMMAMQKYQPEIRRLQQEHKGDRQKLNEELMRFYKDNGINPMGSCLPLLIQMPVFFVLYRVVKGITHTVSGVFDPQYLDHGSRLYESLKGSTKMGFLGIDLARSAAKTLREDSIVSSLPYLVIIAVVTATSYIQQKQVSGRNPSADINPMQKNLMRVLPLSFAVFSFQFPAALGLYFMTSNLYQVAQQSYISRALYGIRRGERPEVVDVAEVEPKQKPKPKAKVNDEAAPRRTSGRVTEPKRPNGRVTPRSGSTTGPARPQRSPSQNPRRRQPFGPTRPADGEPESDRKKRRR